MTRRILSLSALVLLWMAAACSRDPVKASREYVASGDAYVANKQLNQAIIQYANAAKAKPDWAEAHYKLAKAYRDSGEPVKAYASYARAADLDPSNVDAQIQAGTLLLIGGEFDQARTRAELALKADEKSAPAHILLGNALAGMNDTARAVKQIEEAISLDPASAPAWTALGAVRFIGGNRESSGEAFRKAVELAPASVDAHMALANYEWASGKTEEAERTLLKALSLDGTSPSAHRALALLYVTTRRAAQAEPHFKALVEQPGGRLALADYYIGMGNRDAALAELKAIEAGDDKADSRAARLRIASLDYNAGRTAEAHQILDQLLKERPRNEEARIVKARLLLKEGKPDDAAGHAVEAVKADSSSQAAHYTLGLISLARRDFEAAEKSFQEVIRLNPRAAAAQTQLARLQLARGETAGAVNAAQVAARDRPDDPEAAVLLSRSLRADGDLPRAEKELATRLARQPEAAPLHVEMGWLALQRRQPAAARASFEKALSIAPELHDARVGAISADVADRKLEQARARLDEWLAKSPGDTRLQLLSSRVFLVANQPAEAERTLRGVVTSDASQLEAYDLLGRLYMGQGQLDRALTEYQTLASKVKEPAGALTMVAMIHEARGDKAAARTAYERALEADPHAGVAANNLAWIYAGEQNLDQALRLATVAKDAMRQRPEAEDTLGWIYYLKGLHGHAIPAFERALERAPDNPVYHYHLGLAQLRAGNVADGRKALQRALELKPDFNGAGEARKALAAHPE